jgi:hypothetical protein
MTGNDNTNDKGTTMTTTANEIDVAAIVNDAVNDVIVTRIKRGNATKLLVTNLVEDGLGVEASVIGGKRAERNDYVVVVGFVADDGFLRVIVDGTRNTLAAAQARANSRDAMLAGWWWDRQPKHVTTRVVKVSA